MGTSPSSDTDEETLTFKTPRVPAGQRVRCVNRPEHPPFLWQRFKIKNPELWLIFNVAVGANSLFAQNPGDAGVLAWRLNEKGLLCKDVCRVAQDFAIDVMYIGPEGAAFDGAVIGRVPR